MLLLRSSVGLSFASLAIILTCLHCGGQAVTVRQVLGTSRAFLSIRDGEGKSLGYGTFTQVVHGTRVSSTLTLRFRDGSVDEETSHFIQSGTLRLLDDHHVQRGPFFPKPIDMSLEAGGNVSIKTVDGGRTKIETSHIDMPPDVADGMLGATMLNLAIADGGERKISYVAPTGKGRLIQVKITHERPDNFTIVGSSVPADVYRVHYELGGVAGVVAPIVGKQPLDSFVWLTHGVPSIVREQAALYEGGPVLSLELAGASFERASDTRK